MDAERTFRCRACGEERVASSPTGALPSTCDDCDPEGAQRRARSRARNRRASGARQQPVEDLEARQHRRLVLADELIARFDELGEEAGDEPGRAAITSCVHALARASGPDATREALVDLAGAALAWAEVLSPGYRSPLERAVRRLAA